ncbi:uncharacterized protein LOC121653945 [Melanotaenia boesemani]|uniref:uncharacterized protein LOC121653945 n=1 Tax=Melanotaenia boesemani TaxID=1250792 RepID=UPI001C0576D6|nr:uncharacterized protein LOC121653945 [Melanotaenia boesemani]
MRCRRCGFISSSQEGLLRHHQLRHKKETLWPCVFSDCVCTFKTPGALKSHLTRSHCRSEKREETATFFCELCEFREICTQRTFFTHLGHHLKNQETVHCPFLHCDFKSNNFKTFSSHRSRKHKNTKGIRNCFRSNPEKETFVTEPHVLDQSSNSEVVALPSSSRADSSENGGEDFVEAETIEHKLASLFLCMQTVLHVSKSAVQKIIEELNDILHFSKQHSHERVRQILTEHNIKVDDSVVQEVTDAVFNTNPLIVTTEAKGVLSTDHRRNLYFKDHFPVIDPTEYIYKRTHRNTFVYVSVIRVLENLLRQPDFSEKLVFNREDKPGHYWSFRDGRYFKANRLLGVEETSISIGLYIDDFEVCNPLGTSRKIHKITAIYWVVLNLPSKFRSTLPLIQLAALGKSADVKLFGYEAFFYPLIEDIKCLERDGVYVEVLDKFVKGTVFCVCADNLGAHSLAGFSESFNVEKFCRFCCLNRHQIGTVEARDFPLRTVEQHDQFVAELKSSDKDSVNGVKGACALSEHLSYFHPVTGFPPDILHDFFEGVIPVELCLCLKDLIKKGFITLDGLNSRIKLFPYKFSDKVNKPQQITKASFGKGRISGNGHENWTLLRLLPLLIGSSIPEQEASWEILMDLKEIVEIVLSTTLSEEILCYLESKISDHRKLLLDTFPDFRCLPKHHFIEHYVHLISCFGPLVDLWTIRFESKHSFFKKVVHDVLNFKNVLLTLSSKHQQMMAYYLDGQDLFKPKLHVSNVDTVNTTSLEEKLRKVIEKKFHNQDTVSLAKDVYIYGTRYTRGMIVSAGQCSGLPEFHKILNIVVNFEKVCFVTSKLSSWFMEHYRSYEVIDNGYADIEILETKDLNDYHPLAAYTVTGKLMVTARTCLLH